MTESFIESAMLSLSNAFNNDAVNVHCYPLSDALAAVSNALSLIKYEVAVLKDSQENVRQQLSQGLDEVQEVKMRGLDLEHRVSLLTTDAHGFVQRPELLERCQQVRSDLLQNIRLESGKHESSLDTLTTRQHETTVAMQTLQTEFDSLHKEYETSVAEIRHNHATAESSLRTGLTDIVAQHRHLVNHHNDFETSTRIWQDETRRMNDAEFAAIRMQTRNEIQDHVEQVLAHMKEQAEVVDSVKRAHSARLDKIPTIEAAEELKQEMRQAQKNIEESQHRLAETFAQCMAMIGSTSISYGPGGTASNLYSNSSRNTSAYGGRGGEHGVPASMELQLDLLRRDVVSVREQIVPACVAQIQAVAEDGKALAAAHARSELLIMSACEAVGLGDGDELKAALSAKDHAKVVLLLRRALGVITAKSYDVSTVRSKVVELPTPETPPRPTPKKGAKKDVDPKAKPPNGKTKEAGREFATDPMSPASDDNDRAEKPPEWVLDGSTAMVAPSAWSPPREQPSALDSASPLRFRRAAAPKPPTLGMDVADAVGGHLGINVMLVAPDGLAAKHGVHSGDRIIRVNGEDCNNCKDFVSLLHIAARRSAIAYYAQGGELSPTRGKGLKAMGVAEDGPLVEVELTLVPAHTRQTKHVRIVAPIAS